jgi:hypothetical protein
MMGKGGGGVLVRDHDLSMFTMYFYTYRGLQERPSRSVSHPVLNADELPSSSV